MIITCCAAFALPAWVACYLITMNDAGKTIGSNTGRDRHDHRTYA